MVIRSVSEKEVPKRSERERRECDDSHYSTGRYSVLHVMSCERTLVQIFSVIFLFILESKYNVNI